MPDLAVEPIPAHTFRVEFGPAPSGGPDDPDVTRGLSGGYAEIVLPEVVFRSEGDKVRREFTSLVLRRAVTADTAISRWWSKPVPRDCRVVLGKRDGPLAVFQVSGAQPLRYTHSVLNAMDQGVCMESMELSVRDFRRVERL